MTNRGYIVNKEYCMSSFLMYRRVVGRKAFKEGKNPETIPEKWDRVGISNSEQLEVHLKKRMLEITQSGKKALALSGGIDSAILAKFMPKGSTAYTFKCVAEGINTVDETAIAAKYAAECGLKHKIVEVTWNDMERYAPILMTHKKAPIHSIEVQIFKAGMQALKDGFDGMIYGETADVNYGGLSKILSKDWMVGEFIERYAYLKPWKVLKKPVVEFIDFSPYVDTNGFVDVHKYLSTFDIIESLNSYVNASKTANIGFYAPYADTYLNTPLNYERIRNGENKYLIRELFKKLYPNFNIPEKLPMPRPTDEWLKQWEGPTRMEFLPNCVTGLTGDQKWLLWSLEKFLDMNEEKSGDVLSEEEKT